MSQQHERLQKISQYYDLETNNYDDGYSSITCKAEDAIVSGILSQIVKGRVLDLGSGSGLLCEMMEIDDYVGVELSPKMTNLAKTKHPYKNFAVADMHELPFVDGSFDSVVSIYGPLSYSLKPDALLSEILRVVKPGGYIALMPYTLRVGYNLEVGGYSTATKDDIEKIFYTTELLSQLLTPLEEVEIFGINYFLSTYVRFSQAMNLNNEQSIELFIDFLRREKTLRKDVPAEFARHMIGIGRKPFT